MLHIYLGYVINNITDICLYIYMFQDKGNG